MSNFTDEVKHELDRRIPIHPRELEEAEIVYLCSCGTENDIDVERCKGCGMPI